MNPRTRRTRRLRRHQRDLALDIEAMRVRAMAYLFHRAKDTPHRESMYETVRESTRDVYWVSFTHRKVRRMIVITAWEYEEWRNARPGFRATPTRCTAHAPGSKFRYFESQCAIYEHDRETQHVAVLRDGELYKWS